MLFRSRPQGGEKVGYPPVGGEGVRISDQKGQRLAREGKGFEKIGDLGAGIRESLREALWKGYSENGPARLDPIVETARKIVEHRKAPFNETEFGRFAEEFGRAETPEAKADIANRFATESRKLVKEEVAQGVSEAAKYEVGARQAAILRRAAREAKDSKVLNAVLDHIDPHTMADAQNVAWDVSRNPNIDEPTKARALDLYDKIPAMKEAEPPKATPVEIPEPRKFAKAEELPTHIDVEGIKRPTTDSTGAPIHTTEEGVKNFWKSFGDTKALDAEGRPIVVYRGSIGGEEVKEGALEGKAREGYATFASSSPYVAATYAQPDAFELQHPPVAGAIAPYYVNAKKIIEFPVKDGSFDKFEFDRRAKMLPPGTVLVARNARDVGPRASLKTDPDRLFSYGSDIYAWGPGTVVKSAIGNKGEFDITQPDIRKAVVRNPDQGALPLDVSKFSDVKTGKDLLERYIQHGTHKELGDLSQQLLQSPYAKDVKVNFVKTGDTLSSDIVNAFRTANGVTETDPSGSTVYFRGDIPDSFTEHVLTHEMVHGLTTGSIARNPAIKDQLSLISSKINGALANAAKHPSAPADAKNVAEFWSRNINRDPGELLAYGLTSPTFRDVLSQYTADGTRITDAEKKNRAMEASRYLGREPERPQAPTLWNRFTDFMRKLFGIPEKHKAAFEKALTDYHGRIADRQARIEELSYMKPALAHLEESLQALLKTTEKEGTGLPKKQVSPQMAKHLAEGEQDAKEAIEKAPKLTGLAADMRKESFGDKLADTARDLFKEGRKTSFTSEWLDMYDALGKATKNRPMMVDHKAAVDMVASAYAQAGNLLTEATHNGYIIPNGDGTYRVKKDTDVALERIYRDINSAGKAEDRKSTRLNSSHIPLSRMPSSA